MTIFWHGQSCFQIISSQGKNNHVNIVIDPYSEDIGLKVPKLAADILLVSHGHHDHNNVKAVGGNPFLVSGPGEYEIKEVFIQGIPAFHDSSLGKERGTNTIYTIETEELKLCHLGDLGQKELTSEQIDKIGQVDILMIPIGGVYTISAKEAVKIMSQIEPNIIIPMHYQLPKLKLKLDGLDKFLKTMGMKKLDSLPKLFIKKKDILPEEAKIIVLQP
ncbi:MAG: MBL fold metallo-hydrolase [Candidatus Nealsonbacteria bacterium]|nr:MBL fold metallo-hydrolase [Candidatus Nealsonbacteria bacterium]